jgi:hypothetical protein
MLYNKKYLSNKKIESPPVLKESKLINDINYICRSMEKQNKNSELIIDKIKENYKKNYFKTIRKSRRYQRNDEDSLAF